MASYFKTLCTYVKQLVYDENDEEFHQFMQNYSPPEPVKHSTPQVKMTGTITTLNNGYVLIDDEYGYQPPVMDDNLKVGSKVWYTVQHLENESRVVTGMGLLSIHDEEEWTDWGSNVATVTSFNGRDVCLSNSMTCNLDHVVLKRGYSVAEGDSVSFEVQNVRGRDIVVKLMPNLEQRMKGYISEVDGCNGWIKSEGEDIWFTGDVLAKNYTPQKGDNVKLTAMISHCPGKTGKRAIAVEFVDNQSVVVDDLEHIGDVQISTITDFKTVDLMDYSKSLTLTITNTGTEMVTLIRGHFRRPQSQLSVANFKFPKKLGPSTECCITFDLRPKFIGMNSETYDFYFNGFRISRTFSMLIRAEFMKELKIQGARYKHKEFNEYARVERETSTYGTTPFVRKHFRGKTQRYIIPPKMKHILTTENRRNFKNLLDSEYPLLSEEVTPKNYAEKFHLLLFLEEMFLKFQFTALRRDHVFFKQCGEYLALKMPGLLEQRPSLIVGDKVIVTQPWQDEKICHIGFIHNITMDTIYVDFNEAFKNNYKENDCSVEFEAQMGAITLKHRAIDEAKRSLLGKVLFPLSLDLKTPLYNVQKTDIGWFNKGLNRFQKNAVVNVLHGKCRPYPYVIFGPPGTGKTSTVTELILQIMRYGDSRILVCAPSNSAADLLTKRLVQFGRLNSKEIVRIVAYCKSMESIDPDIEEFCAKGDDETNKLTVPLGFHKITVGTCTSIGILNEHVQFTHVVIDEAGCATEPETLISLNFLQTNGLTVLAGDPKQLGPTVLSKTIENYGLSESFLARLMASKLYTYDAVTYPKSDGYNPNLVTCLKINYRSVPEILAVPNRLFYNSSLLPTITGKTGREAEIIQTFNELRPIRSTPASVIFHGVRGTNYQEADSPSWVNPEEISEAYLYVKDLLKKGVLPVEIGIICPYRKQVLKLREILTQFLGVDTIKIGSVEEFQGQERLVIILSAVRSTLNHLDRDQKQLLGFLCDPRRLNVALTRPRALLIVLGNPHVLGLDVHWRELIKYCLEGGTYIGCDLPQSLVRFGKEDQQNVQKNEENTEDDDSW